MAITSEIIGKLGGGDVETISVNRLIKRGDPFYVMHTITVDKPSLVAATITHDNSTGFGDHGTAAMAIRGTNNVHYTASYGVRSAFGKPLSIAAEVSAGTWTIEVACNALPDHKVYVTEFTAETLTVATVKM